MRFLALAVIVACGCGDDAPASVDAPPPEVDAAIDAAPDAGTGCATNAGESGECLATSECMAMPKHSMEAGHCPGPATIQCCVVTPNVANNPPVPAGYRLMRQSEVTTAMTNWAVMILHDPVTYPMFATTTMAFGAQTVLARVEWHPPDFNNMTIHRGVTLYV